MPSKLVNHFKGTKAYIKLQQKKKSAISVSNINAHTLPNKSEDVLATSRER